MTKFRKSLLIFGILVLLIGAALGTFIVLSLTGSLKDEPIALEFTIGNLPREYNGKPQKASKEDKDCFELVSMDGFLVEGHTLDFEFTGEQTDVGYCPIGLDVKVVNENGYDVTDQYKIKVNKGLLYVYKRAANIKLTSTSDLIYDGKSIDISDKYTASGIVNGHRVSLKLIDDWYDSSDKIVIGTIDSRFVEYQILDGNGSDVSANYALESFSGSLSVVRRPITISPVSAEKTYDGKPLTCTDYKIDSGSLVAGHYIDGFSLVSEDGYPELTNAGSVKIQIANPIIRDLEGNNVTGNYNVTPGIGTLTVRKAPLIVTAKSASWAYDGNEHSLQDDNEPYSVSGLVNDENVTVEYVGSVLDVSTEVNRIVDCNIDNGGDGNYAITFVDGKLEVTKAQLTISLEPIDGQYGDTFNTNIEDLYTIDSTINNLHLQLADKDYVSNLLKKAEIGVSAYTLTNFKILNGLEDDITDRFNIIVIPGNLSISRREVELEVTGLSKTYDGNLTFKDGAEIQDLVNGHRVESVTVNAENKIESISLVDLQGNDVSRYYDVTYPESVSVSIGQRDLSISTQSLTKVYDGQPLYGGDVILNSSLAFGDVIVTSWQASITEYKDNKANNNQPEFEIYNKYGEPVKDKYYNIVSADYGTLIVTKANLTIIGKSDSFVYDGNSHSSAGAELIIGLAPCDKVTLTYKASPIKVGIEDNNDFDYLITGIGTDAEADTVADTDTETGNGAKTDKSDNYVVDKVVGTLQITKAPLTVALKPITIEYGDSYKESEFWKLSDDNLTLNLSDEFDINELLGNATVGTSTYSINEFTISSGDADVTDNFDVNVISGNVTVKPRAVTIGDTLTKPYDGNLKFTENLITANNLVEGHKVSFVVLNDEYNIESISLCDEDGNDVTSNYKVTCTANVEITSRKLSIRTESFEKVYDGTPLYGGEIVILADKQSLGLALGDVLVTTKQASATNVSIDNATNKIKSVTNNPEFVILNSKGEDVKDYYNLGNYEDNLGTLTITPKTLNVSLSTVYYPSSVDEDSLKDYLSNRDLSGSVIVSGFVNNEKYQEDYEVDISFDIDSNMITVDVNIDFYPDNPNYVLDYFDITGTLVQL